MNTPNRLRRRLFLAAQQAAEDFAECAALAAEHTTEDAAEGLVAGAPTEDAAQDLAQAAAGGFLFFCAVVVCSPSGLSRLPMYANTIGSRIGSNFLSRSLLPAPPLASAAATWSESLPPNSVATACCPSLSPAWSTPPPASSRPRARDCWRRIRSCWRARDPASRAAVRRAGPAPGCGSRCRLRLRRPRACLRFQTWEFERRDRQDRPSVSPPSLMGYTSAPITDTRPMRSRPKGRSAAAYGSIQPFGL